MLLSESSAQLNVLHKKLGKAVDKARPYHEQLKVTKQVSIPLLLSLIGVPQNQGGCLL